MYRLSTSLSLWHPMTLTSRWLGGAFWEKKTTDHLEASSPSWTKCTWEAVHPWTRRGVRTCLQERTALTPDVLWIVAKHSSNWKIFLSGIFISPFSEWCFSRWSCPSSKHCGFLVLGKMKIVIGLETSVSTSMPIQNLSSPKQPRTLLKWKEAPTTVASRLPEEI